MKSGATPALGPSSSSSLLARVLARDPLAWENVTRVYGPDVYRWARQAGLQDADAADLVQETFQAVSTSLESYQRGSRPGFRAWLWGIAKHKLQDHFRRLGGIWQPTGGTAAHHRLLQAAEPPEDATEEGRPLQRGRLAHRVLALIQQDFAPTTWQAFWHSVVEGKSHDSIAADLNLSTKAVRQAKCRVLKRLRELGAELIE
jgi:RNA polymerase sigma-70 factor (ECF subfamily)